MPCQGHHTIRSSAGSMAESSCGEGVFAASFAYQEKLAPKQSGPHTLGNRTFAGIAVTPLPSPEVPSAKRHDDCCMCAAQPTASGRHWTLQLLQALHGTPARSPRVALEGSFCLTSSVLESAGRVSAGFAAGTWRGTGGRRDCASIALPASLC